MANTMQTQDQTGSVTVERERPYAIPPANITADQNEYVLELEMPGVRKNAVDISVDGQDLTILGHCTTELAPRRILLLRIRAGGLSARLLIWPGH